MIKSIRLGASKFWSIIFSKPLPIDTTTKICGIRPIKVAQKKLEAFTLKIHGRTLDNAKWINQTNI